MNNIVNGFIKAGARSSMTSMSKQKLELAKRTKAVVDNAFQPLFGFYKKELDIVGLGFRAIVTGSTLRLTLGRADPVYYILPAGIFAKVEKKTHLVLLGRDRSLLAQVAHRIRSFQKPNPYTAKGIKFTEELIVRKKGKSLRY